MQVERQTSLVGVEVQEDAAGLRVGPITGKRAHASGRVSARRFDLENVGAKVSK